MMNHEANVDNTPSRQGMRNIEVGVILASAVRQDGTADLLWHSYTLSYNHCALHGKVVIINFLVSLSVSPYEDKREQNIFALGQINYSVYIHTQVCYTCILQLSF